MTHHIMMPSALHGLEHYLEVGPYLGYTYAYPHKTAYRQLSSPIAISDAWEHEARGSLFLYVHIPFCEMRCGYCNLFASAQPTRALTDRYLDAVERQARVVAHRIRPVVTRVAIGGGTPTILEAVQLRRLLSLMDELGVELAHVPVSIEASPATVSRDKLRVLRDAGIDRISMGIQTWDDSDAGRLGRPQSSGEVHRSLEAIRDFSFPTLNLDLIYGARGQTRQSWLASLEQTVAWEPREIYLYPLYVGPLTGLSRRQAAGPDPRPERYREGRTFLLERGYRQVSMRMFRHTDGEAPVLPEPPLYRCQEDGMIGLGCGARSYTHHLHYADRYAVSSSATRSVIETWTALSTEDHAVIRRGIELNDQEVRRRHLLLSLLNVEGLDRNRFRERFGADVLEVFPELNELAHLELGHFDDARIALTAKGIEFSDTIGPWLYSADVRRRMEEFQWENA